MGLVSWSSWGQIDKYIDAEPRDTVEKDYKRYKSKTQR